MMISAGSCTIHHGAHFSKRDLSSTKSLMLVRSVRVGNIDICYTSVRKQVQAKQVVDLLRASTSCRTDELLQGSMAKAALQEDQDNLDRIGKGGCVHWTRGLRNARTDYSLQHHSGSHSGSLVCVSLLY